LSDMSDLSDARDLFLDNCIIGLLGLPCGLYLVLLFIIAHPPRLAAGVYVWFICQALDRLVLLS
jgi:hypothetical protein